MVEQEATARRDLTSGQRPEDTYFNYLRTEAWAPIAIVVQCYTDELTIIRGFMYIHKTATLIA